MKKVISFVCVLLMLVTFSSCNVSFGDFVFYADAEKYSVGNVSLENGEIKRVEINWVGGKIDISVSEDGTFSASEENENLDSEERMHYFLDRGTLIIQYCESGYNSDWLNSSHKELTIALPEGIDLDIDNISSDIVFSTDIVFEDVDINTVSGNVSIKKLTADSFDFESVSGEIFADEINAERLDGENVFGDINIESFYGYEFDAETVSGNIDIGIYDKTDVNIDSVSGAVHIYLSKNIGLETEFSSVSGNLRTELPYTWEGDIYIFGSPDVKAHINTVSGNLYIK